MFLEKWRVVKGSLLKMFGFQVVSSQINPFFLFENSSYGNQLAILVNVN